MSPVTLHAFTFRSFLVYLLIGISVLIFTLYVLFQARLIIAGPRIALTKENASVQTERVITLEGTASNIVSMTLDGRQIYTDINGNFKEALVLENGYTIATLQAKDRYGRMTSLTQKFVYTGNHSAVIN